MVLCGTFKPFRLFTNLSQNFPKIANKVPPPTQTQRGCSLFSPKVEAELGLLLLRSSPAGRERFDWSESRLVSSSELAEFEPSEAFLFTEGNDFLIFSKKERFSSALSASLSGKSVTDWFLFSFTLILTFFLYCWFIWQTCYVFFVEINLQQIVVFLPSTYKLLTVSTFPALPWPRISLPPGGKHYSQKLLRQINHYFPGKL